MEKVQQVYREIFYQAIEKNERSLTQLELAKRLRVSLSLVNFALKPLRQMGAIDVGPR
jgi:Mn-dependent DtxR family transcriptional regulator